MIDESKFLQARMQIAAKIQKLETDLKYWREELQAFDRVETTMRRLVDSSGNGQRSDLTLESERPTDERDEGSEGSAEDRAKILASLMANPPKKRGDLKNRVLAVVSGNKDAKVSSTDVERAILQSGYKPTGKHFDIAVYQTLNRLAAAKLIKRKKYAGNVKFSANTE